MRTHKFAIFVAAAMAAFLTTTIAALAVPAVAKSAVNVRTGPGVNFVKVDTLQRGERVSVTQCQNGWCYVQKSGPNGWVSANFLTRVGGNNNNRPHSPNNPALNFGFSINSGGPSFSITIGNSPPTSPLPQASKVCFYNGANYTGAQFCVNSGSNNRQLTGFWNNKISSFRVYGGAKVQLCKNWNYGGICYGYSSNRSNLPFQINNKTSSFQTWN